MRKDACIHVGGIRAVSLWHRTYVTKKFNCVYNK